VKQTKDVPQIPRRYVYRIVVEGRISSEWQGWFGGLTISPKGEETLLEGSLPDASALYGTLNNLASLNLTLVSVERVEINEFCTTQS
jgi:hypothetical protein